MYIFIFAILNLKMNYVIFSNRKSVLLKIGKIIKKVLLT